MARLPILEYPDPRLRIRAESVTKVDSDLRKFVEDLFETMYAAPGIGLAATQVDMHKRVIAIDVSDEHDDPLCLINPEIIEAEGIFNAEEGCLSLPGLYDFVDRAQKIRVRALDRDGEVFERDAEGLLAVCIQHEMDHLEGKLFVDYLSPLKRERIKKRFKKRARRDEPSGAPAHARSL